MNSEMPDLSEEYESNGFVVFKNILEGTVTNELINIITYPFQKLSIYNNKSTENFIWGFCRHSINFILRIYMAKSFWWIWIQN